MLATAACCGTADAAPVTESGYVAMADGVKLRYTVVRPADSGRFPVAMKYDGYCEGTDPMTCNEGQQAAALLKAGYAVAGVSVRGTGCSEGQFDLRSELERTDGVAVVEWAARQPWSTGKVGLFGDSFPGLTQPRVAASHPKGLAAIAPWQIVDDLYRDVAYPGGLANYEFGVFWGIYNQPAAAAGSAATGTQAGDPQCAQSALAQATVNPATNIFVAAMQHAYVDPFWTARAVGDAAGRIEVPALACTSWQDDEVGSRAAWTLFPRLDPQRLWMIGTNGHHGLCAFSAATTAQLVRFFDRYVKGLDNGFETTPHTQLWHDTTDATDARPGWVTSGGAWPPRTSEHRLFLGTGGALRDVAPSASEPADTYVSPTVSAGTENGIAFGQAGRLWKLPGVPPGGAQAYTTPRLQRDAELLGPASLDLWLSSTATDTNLQATITEVRPDGQEVYVARGWLNATERRLDERTSTAVMPEHTHLQRDLQPLTPGEPTLIRVGVFPFDYVFRVGSRIRVIVDTPSQTGGWNLEPVANAGVNTILHDAAHPSALVVSTLPGGTARAGHPACDTVLNQPCRPDAYPASAPAGELPWPTAAAATGNCRPHGIRVRLRRAPRRDSLRSATIAVDGKIVRRIRGRGMSRLVKLRPVPPKAFRVTITLRTTKGRTLRSVRRYRACR